MAKVEVWPYDVSSDRNGRFVFSPMTFTIKEIIPARDGTSKMGKAYHLPPRVIFEEDPMAEEWSMGKWIDAEGGGRKKVDFEGPFPISGDRVSVKLQTSPGNGDRVWRDVDVDSMVLLNSNLAATPPVAPAPPAPATPEPQGAEDTALALDKIPEQQRIAGTALTNVLAPKVWDDAPDGDEWKEFMRKAIKHYTMLQIPPKLREIIEAEESPNTDDDLTDEVTETVDW